MFEYEDGDDDEPQLAIDILEDLMGGSSLSDLRSSESGAGETDLFNALIAINKVREEDLVTEYMEKQFSSSEIDDIIEKVQSTHEATAKLIYYFVKYSISEAAHSADD
jgi:BioD-like phosphotransacetylase family protein